MAIYKGVIAGIGDKISNTNVITPQFDARVNKFIIGQNCIFDGLILNGNTLSAGSCLAEGYRGELKANTEIELNELQKQLRTLNGTGATQFTIANDREIPISEIKITGGNYRLAHINEPIEPFGDWIIVVSPHVFNPTFSVTIEITYGGNYIYGVFKINHDSSVIDEFFIETSISKILMQDDILHKAGTYYLLLYKNGVAKQPHNYPAKAVNSDNTAYINDGGSLGNDVTCPTQAINDNSDKVANTEYVHNQIVEEIGYDIKKITVTVPYVTTPLNIGEIMLKRKAKYVIGEIPKLDTVTGGSDKLVFSEIPDGFRPKKIVYFVFSVQYYSTNTVYGTRYYICKMEPSGNISVVDTIEDSSRFDREPYVLGYESN